MLLRLSLGVASSDTIKTASFSPRPLVCTGDFKIKEAIHHLQHVMLRPDRERKGGPEEEEWPSAQSFNLEISISHKNKTLVLQNVPFALSGACLMDN